MWPSTFGTLTVLSTLLLAAPAAPAAVPEPPDTATILRDLNEASAASVAVVQINCFQFLPDRVDFVTGDTVRWQWADACGQSHTVTSSGSTLDPEQDLEKPKPSWLARCFDSSQEPPGRMINAENPNYEVSLGLYAVVIRNLGQPSMKVCAGDNSIRVNEDNTLSGVLPYACRVHGLIQPAGSGMRGVLVVGL